MMHIDRAFIKAYDQLAHDPQPAPKSSTDSKRRRSSKPAAEPVVDTAADLSDDADSVVAASFTPPSPSDTQIVEVSTAPLTYDASPETNSSSDRVPLAACPPVSPSLPASTVSESSWVPLAACPPVSPSLPASTVSVSSETEVETPLPPTADVKPLEVKTPAKPSSKVESKSGLRPLAAALPVESKLPAPTPKKATFTWPDDAVQLSAQAAAGLASLVGAMREESAAGRKVVLVTSCQRGEGRTSVALCLARAFAQGGLKTALVESDFARPSIAERLGLTVECGWAEVVKGEASLHEAALASEDEPLSVLPLAASGPSPSDSHAPRQRLILSLLRREHDVVLIDAGPLVDRRAGLLHCPQVDMALLIQRSGLTSDAEIWAAEQELSDAGLSVWGVARNFEDAAACV